jgi:adenylate cyclase
VQEIERKFIIKSIPFPLDKYPYEDISQGYLAASADGGEVRVRQKGDHYFLTVKKGSGLERQETEIAISQTQFQELYQATAHDHVEKKRFIIQDEDRVIELDIFEGKLKGLMVAEVEFKSINDSRAYRAPSWFGMEVTEDERFANRNLAKYGLPLQDF